MKFQPALHTLLFLVFTLLLPLTANAHEPDHSYLYMRIYGEAIGGRVEVTGEDINRIFGVNINEELQQDEMPQYINQLQAYIKDKVQFSSGGTVYPIKFTEPDILSLNETVDFLRCHFDLENVPATLPEKLKIDYNMFFDEIETQKGVLIIEYNWKAGIINNQALINTVFGRDDRSEELVLADKGVWKGFVALVKLGIWHIWIGLDHILFIVALILPAVVRRREEPHLGVADDSYSKEWMPVEKFKPAFFYIIKIITFFTVAHSITLALAALEIVSLPSRIVETIIAISIALAALHNITPIFKAKEWIIAFAFGLFHGFGFASVLGEKGLSGDFMVLSLLGFNVGVEVGQVLIICLVFPFLFLLRPYKIYPKILFWGSILLILISLYWGIERGFEVDLPLGAYFWKMYHAVLG